MRDVIAKMSCRVYADCLCRRFKKNFKALHVVHSSWTLKVQLRRLFPIFLDVLLPYFDAPWPQKKNSVDKLQAALALCTTLVSPKFSKKINYCATLAELRDKLGVQLDLPNFVVYEFLPICSFLLFLLPFARFAQSPCFPTTLTILHSVNTMGRCDSRCSI